MSERIHAGLKPRIHTKKHRHAGLKPRLHNVCGWDTCGGGPSGTAEYCARPLNFLTTAGAGRPVLALRHRVSGAICASALVDCVGTGHAIAIRHETSWVYSIGAGDTARADLRAAG
jgi:hypothetical protein